mmetsp:Transcript_105672/g.264587  ORF Transcript_105672/g.264587 Transcript_105672/m.264587 type:complete len:271 (-) Transcript_105672:124-936(-)
MPDGVEAKDVKFLGVVQSFNEAKKFGMVASEEAHAMWGQEIYAYKDVLAAANANVGDTIRFGVHVNTRGQPQVSLPVFKLGEDGMPIGVPEGTAFVCAEEAAASNPNFLEELKAEIEGRSYQQNQKRSRMGGGKGGDSNGWGGGGDTKRARSGGNDHWGNGGGESFQWGGGGWGGCGGNWGPQEVTLFVSGLPPGVERREVLHIFRQYAGFSGLRLVNREDHTIAFVSFATMAQAQFVAEALTGYIFDEEAPADTQVGLTLQPAKDKKRM